MKKKKRRSLALRVLTAAIVSAALCALVWSGLLDDWDSAVSDRLYQHPTATDGRITVIGMDQEAVDEIGPLPWSRDIMARVIENLNADPNNRPAVIGVDVIYAGEGADQEADAHLVRAASAGNVVLAAIATYGDMLVFEDGEFRMDTGAVLQVDTPFPALSEVAPWGHVNAMLDSDGMLRHALSFVEYGDERIPSLARVLYERWCAAEGTEPLPFTTEADGIYYIPFTTGPRGYYEGVSVAAILNEDFDPSYYAGKLVLIGPYSSGMQDEYRTSVDHGEMMYGVEVLANLIDAFRAGFAPRELDERVQLALLFAICFASLLYFYDRKLQKALLVWLLVCGGWVAACFLLYRAQWVLHVLWVPLFETVLFIVSLSLSYLRSKRDERRLSAIFGRYVDPSIIRTLLEVGGDELELGGKLYEIAALFVDIRGFTTMSESMEPPEVVEIINRYLNLTTDCVMRYHGTLDKFVGDCTMAYWNAPVHQEDSVYLACRAAMDMVDGAAELGRELTARYGRSVSFGIGVNVGPAVIGNIGSPMHMDYTAIGDTVNTAARLEANAPGGKIYITRAVADALGERAKTTSLGNTVKLKGKSEIEVLSLDALEQEPVKAPPPDAPLGEGESASAAVVAVRSAVYAGEWTCPVCGLENDTLFCPDCGFEKPGAQQEAEEDTAEGGDANP